ncbi:hypothetical protein F4781DRAFT_418180 [Annulohypoxylon bovei var. microspora]|nr:hypothetical protein F4781DRAFT_418180 [Annulohypoxylon bovei var. microspora]
MMASRAWETQQAQIDQFLDRIETRNASAACIYGPHATGKSTSMVAHILEVVRAKIPDTSVVYLLPTSLEADLLTEYLVTDDKFGISRYIVGKNPQHVLLPAGSLCITSYDDMLGEFRKRDLRFPFSQRTVVLLDLEGNPTTGGELLFGRLSEWARLCHEKERPASAIVTISPFRSARTEDALLRVVRRHPKVITITAETPAVPVNQIGKAWLPRVAELVKVADSLDTHDGRVLLAADVKGEDFGGIDFDPIDVFSIQNNRAIVHSLNHGRIYLLNHDIGFSLSLFNMRDVATDGLVTEPFFDPGTSHIILGRRKLTKTEILRQQSWLLKSTLPLGETVFHTTDGPGDFASRKPGLDPPGKAYGGDLMWMALSLVHEWPSTMSSHLPVRHPPDNLAMREAMRRILVVGCIEVPDAQSIGKTTTRGSQMLALRRQVGDTVGLDFHAAHLLACIPVYGSEMSTSVKRVIIRLASLLIYGIGTICSKKKSAESPYLDEIRQQCRGVGARLAHKGAAWIALGLFQAQIWRGTLQTNAAFNQTDWLQINIFPMRLAFRLVRRLEDLFDISTTDEIKDTELTNDEVRFIEIRLMWAYLHRIAVFPDAVEEPPIDMVSHVELSLGETEILDFEYVRRAEENQGGGCFAIYPEISRRGSDYIIDNLTTFPKNLITEVEKDTGMSIEVATAILYPIQR